MQTEARPRIARAGSGREEGGGGKTAMDLYMTLLKACSSSDGLGRPRGSAANYANRQPQFPDADLPSGNLLP
jgi:hypothetical protein